MMSYLYHLMYKLYYVMYLIYDVIYKLCDVMYVKGRPCGSVAQLAECSHGKREALGSSPGRATIFSSPVTFGGSVWVRG